MTKPVDPQHVDIVAQPRRRRRRAVPVPENMQPMVADAEKRARKRPGSPGVLVEPSQDRDGTYSFTSPYVDPNAWELMLADTFGTRSAAVIETFTAQIAELCPKRWDSTGEYWVPEEGALNLAINMVNSRKPKNEIEAALCIQMVATHMMQMKLSARVMSGWGDPQTTAQANKLARTYTMQIDALNRLRGKGKSTRQKITVSYERHNHQHIHYETGGSDENRRQAHAPAARGTGRERGRAGDRDYQPRPGGQIIEATAIPSLPSPDTVGGDVPSCGCQRPAGLSDARRGKGNGRTKGRG